MRAAPVCRSSLSKNLNTRARRNFSATESAILSSCRSNKRIDVACSRDAVSREERRRKGLTEQQRRLVPRVCPSSSKSPRPVVLRGKSHGEQIIPGIRAASARTAFEAEDIPLAFRSRGTKLEYRIRPRETQTPYRDATTIQLAAAILARAI